MFDVFIKQKKNKLSFTSHEFLKKTDLILLLMFTRNQDQNKH